ncbi:MAG TPA: hypothetical protein VFE24_01125, partial [Pirellulales bacterium]|nr:hypothetical protein [Pirellulales bacterium]
MSRPTGYLGARGADRFDRGHLEAEQKMGTNFRRVAARFTVVTLGLATAVAIQQYANFPPPVAAQNGPEPSDPRATAKPPATANSKSPTASGPIAVTGHDEVADAALEAALDKSVTWNFDKRPVTEAIVPIAKELGVKVEIDAGVDKPADRELTFA